MCIRPCGLGCDRHPTTPVSSAVSPPEADAPSLPPPAHPISPRAHQTAPPQAELVQTTKAAIGRDGVLEAAASAAHERADLAMRKLDELKATCQHLRWAVAQAEGRTEDLARESAQLVSERDAALREVAELRDAYQSARQELDDAKKRALDFEADLHAERSALVTRQAETAEMARANVDSSVELKRLQRELSGLQLARSAESISHGKQRLLIARLLELESTFGEMLPPKSHARTPYAQALSELSKLEMALPTGVRGLRTPSSNLSPPLLAGPLPGAEARAVALSVAEAALSGPLAPPHHLQSADGRLHVPRAASLTPSSSLPMLNTKALPVARGAARVAARRGVALRAHDELRSLVTLHSAHGSPLR